jgi:GAF domain-containing protein
MAAEATLPKVSSGHLIFRCEHNRGTSVHDLEGLLRITVEAVGEELQRALLDADPSEELQRALRDADWSEEEEEEEEMEEAITMPTTHVLLTVAVDIPGRPMDAENVREVATEKLVLVGRLLGMTAPPTTKKRPHHEEEIEFAKEVARLLLFASNLTIWGLSDCLSKVRCGLLC